MDSPAHEALAGLLLGTTRVVVLAGLGFGRDDDMELTGSGGDWAHHGSLENLLTAPSEFWAFYHPLAMRIAARDPSPAHHALARLRSAGVVWRVVTQSSDRLHSRAGTEDVVEVHGNILTVCCTRCGERYGLPEVGELIGASTDGVPRCTTPGCGYPLRPSGTLWGEPLPEAGVQAAWDLAAQADLFVVCDSALRTIPISLLPSVPLTRGTPLVILGRTPTQYDRYAAIVHRGPSEPVLVDLARLLLPD